MYSSPCFLSTTPSAYPSVLQSSGNILSWIISRQEVFIGSHLLFLHFRSPFLCGGKEEGGRGCGARKSSANNFYPRTSLNGNNCPPLIFLDTFPLYSLRSRSRLRHKVFHGTSAAPSKFTIQLAHRSERRASVDAGTRRTATNGKMQIGKPVS